MKCTKIREETFKELVLNAGILLSSFTPESPTISPSSILGATNGGITFSATPIMKDNGEGIDNCKLGMAELMSLEGYEDISLSGNFVTVNADRVKSLIAAAEVSGDKITPRSDLKITDFEDLWWVGDYSDKHGETNGGFCAIHMMKTLSTGGFQLQTNDKDKGQFAFTYKAHYSIADQDKVPFEVFLHEGTEEA